MSRTKLPPGLCYGQNGIVIPCTPGQGEDPIEAQAYAGSSATRSLSSSGVHYGGDLQYSTSLGGGAYGSGAFGGGQKSLSQKEKNIAIATAVLTPVIGGVVGGVAGNALWAGAGKAWQYYKRRSNKVTPVATVANAAVRPVKTAIKTLGKVAKRSALRRKKRR